MQSVQQTKTHVQIDSFNIVNGKLSIESKRVEKVSITPSEIEQAKVEYFVEQLLQDEKWEHKI